MCDAEMLHMSGQYNVWCRQSYFMYKYKSSFFFVSMYRAPKFVHSCDFIEVFRRGRAY